MGPVCAAFPIWFPNTRQLDMPRPTDELTDEQLRQGIASGEYDGRDALIAAEILKRRHEQRARWWMGAMAAAVWLWLTVRLRLRKKTAT